MKAVPDCLMSRPLNILYHHRTQGRGAEGVHITSIVSALEAMGHNVTILSPPGIDPRKNAGNAPVDKSNVKTSGINSVWKFISKYMPNLVFELIEIIYNIPSLRNLDRELSRKPYDLIYERYAFYMISGAIKAKKFNIPFVLEANEVSGIENRARKQSLTWLCNAFEKFLFNRCAGIHTVSSFLKKMIVKQDVDENLVHVTPNAIDPNKFCGKKETTDLKNQYNINDKFVIGFAGWFDDWDRLDLLVDVFAKLKSKHKNLILLLVGDGEVLNEVRNKSNHLSIQDSLILTGAVTRDEVHRYISLLDIAVITHSNEFGSPVVMFEFMGLKIPIIAPKLTPITDVLVDDKNAILFDVMAMDELEKKLDHLISSSDTQTRIADAAFVQLMEKHTWHSNAQAILRVINN